MKKDDLFNFVNSGFKKEGLRPEPIQITKYSIEMHCARDYVSEVNKIKAEAKKFYMYISNMDSMICHSPYINYNSNLLYNLIHEICPAKKFDSSLLNPVIENFISINDTYSYFKKVTIDDKKLNNNLDNYFSKQRDQFKEFVFGKAYYEGLSKYRNNLRGGNTNYSNLKLRLILITVDNINYELAFKVSLPLLSTKKIYVIVPITGPDKLKETLTKKACEDFHKAFRSHVITLIANVNKMNRKDKKELHQLSDHDLADLYLVADMQAI